MAFRDLWDFLSLLESRGQLIRVRETVSPRHEVCAVLRHLSQQGGPAALFENVEGYRVPVVGNLFGTEKRIGLALGVEGDRADLAAVFIRGIQAPIAPRRVEKAPAQEVVIREDIDLLRVVPVLTYHQRDVGPYITQGVVLARDPETGAYTMGVHRLQVKGPKRLGIFLASPTLARFLAKAEERGHPLEVAIAIGLDPALVLVAVAWMPFSDKLGAAGSLRGEPVEMVKAETVNLEVPAQAMFVVEGRILPRVRETEGPFGESTGYYITVSNPVIEVTAITHCQNPVYPVFVPFTKEDETVILATAGATIQEELRKIVPSMRDFSFYPLCGTIILSLAGTGGEPSPKRILESLLNSNPYIKHVVLVDEDINPNNPAEVLWALGTRFQADRDLLTLSGVPASPIDPSVGERFLGAKMGLDATAPREERDRFMKVGVPAECEAKAAAILQNYGAGP
jgi:2,5-furandicarboxylate decarboxylase 1